MQKNKNRVIINNRSDCDEITCVELVKHVISQGRISNEGKQYCYATTFNNPKVIVWTSVNKTTDTFTIINEEQK